MKRALLLIVLLAGCRDFDAAGDQCLRDGRCGDGGTGGGAATGGGGSATGGGSAVGGGGSTGGGSAVGGGGAAAGGGVATGGGVAAGGGSAVGGGGGGTGGGGSTCTGRLVTAVHHHLTDNQGTQDTVDSQLVEIELLDGGADTAITPLGDGGWCAANAPSGDVYLKVSTPTPGLYQYVFTSQPAIDLSTWSYGHVAAAASLPNTGLTYSNAGPLSPPWNAEDELDIFSFGSGLALNEISFDAGATTVSSSFTFATSNVARGFLAAPPDLIYLARLYDAGTYSVLNQYAAGTATMIDGVSVLVSDAGFVDVTPNKNVTVTWTAKGTATTFQGDIFPGGVMAVSSRDELDLVPNLADAGAADSIMELAISIGSGLTNANIAYGDPFATNELLESEIHANVNVHYPDAGNVNTDRLLAYFETTQPVIGSSMVIDVQLSPPKSVAVNNQATSLDGYVYATAPVSLSWLPPSLGSPSWYLVQAYALSHSGNTSKLNQTPVWKLLIPDAQVSSVVLPPLTVGGVYIFRVTSGSSTPYDPAAPLRPRDVYNSADAVTGPVIIR